jgi:thiamine kinase-like enzyme
LDRCVRVIEVGVQAPCHEPVAMLQSVRWIARFHAAHEAFALNGVPSFLKRYDEKYYRGWSRRTAKLTRSLQQLHPWLPELCKKEVWIMLLLNAPSTVIHGEFYAKTLLFRNNTVFPIDWESAALAAGEIDFAALTEGDRWPEQVVQHCLREYQQSRWPDGVPADFHQTLDAARLYLHFRWLGEREDWTLRPKTFWRYEHMRAAAERLKLL